jgi:probable phosphoglycerate mutase
MLLYCVRHGESAYNAEGRIQGQSDVPLSGLGHRQSRAVAEVLSGLPVEAIYASPLRRAMQTAQPVAERLNLEIRTDPRLMEIHAGVFQEKLRSQLDELYHEQYARWKSGDPDFAVPGGESRRDLMRRGREVFEEIGRGGHSQVVVVTHGGLLAAAVKALLEIPAERHPFVLQNGSISQLELADGRVRLLSLNQVDHLRDVGYGGCGDL